MFINFNFIITNSTNNFTSPKCLDEQFLSFLSANTRIDKLNVLYIGFETCGLVKRYYGINNINFVLIGCDCLKYKNKTIMLPEQDYEKISFSRDYSRLYSIIESNKISYQMILDIMSN